MKFPCVEITCALWVIWMCRLTFDYLLFCTETHRVYEAATGAAYQHWYNEQVAVDDGNEYLRGPLLQGVMGMSDSTEKTTLWKVLSKAFVTLPVLQTMVVEIKAFLNDRPLTYVSSDLNDPEPLTPSHLLCGQQTTSLPHKMLDDEIDNPTYRAPSVNKWWEPVTATFLNVMEKRIPDLPLWELSGYRTEWTRDEGWECGDIHNNVQGINWELTAVERMITGLDGLQK